MENENTPLVHEQNMGKPPVEKTGIFSPSGLSKIVPIFVLLAGGIFFMNSYFDGVKADEFIEIYNPNVAIIADDMTQLSVNFQNAGEYLLQIEQNPKMSPEESQIIVAKAESFLTENDAIYTRVHSTVEIIETQACTKLENSSSECLAFIGLYSDMIEAFESDNYDTANSIGADLVDKSNIFIEAVKKDNIDFKQL